jgi:hypothetical protein
VFGGWALKTVLPEVKNMKKDTLRAEAVEVVRNTILRIETLETRNRDALDFHDMSVWTLKAALEDAFDRGRAIGRAEAEKEAK